MKDMEKRDYKALQSGCKKMFCLIFTDTKH